MTDLKPCPFCGGKPEIRPVGDWKQYYAAFCSSCGKTTVPHDCASLTIWGARREWNRRVDNGKAD